MTQEQSVDPHVLPPTSWSTRLAALKSRAVPDDDPRVVQCNRALSYWRVKRAVDHERDVLGADGVKAATNLLLELVAS
ncbi:hypothetical protein [Prescottella equi]|uniref:hypothetical protein n=1 Tax=Rhodococcus hoagii TaxID=43767 RepID=UPI000A12301A|nr:hypothetical protein [Prescottella equi]ORL76407.1 hypothetical protein A5N71_16340 [Prescottella equi]